MPKPGQTSPFYDLSAEVQELHQQVQRAALDIPGLWVYRYGIIADNSSRGETCPYALQSLRRSANGEADVLDRYLDAVQDQINLVRHKLSSGFAWADDRVEELNALVS